MTRNGRTLIWLAAGTFVLAVLGVNAHLAYVAFASQPGCIAHVKVGQGAGTGFSAAASSC